MWTCESSDSSLTSIGSQTFRLFYSFTILESPPIDCVLCVTSCIFYTRKAHTCIKLEHRSRLSGAKQSSPSLFPSIDRNYREAQFPLIRTLLPSSVRKLQESRSLFNFGQLIRTTQQTPALVRRLLSRNRSSRFCQSMWERWATPRSLITF